MHLFDIKIPSERQKKAIYQKMIDKEYSNTILAELVEHSPIIIQNSSNSSGRKNLDVRPYDCTTIWPYKVLLLTCMVNCTTGTPMPWLCSVVWWSVHWALSWTTRVLVLAEARRCAFETCREKKMQVPLLGLAKSIYYHNMLLDQPLAQVFVH